jgi:hypothetical protein
MTVPDAHPLLAMRRADAQIHLEHDIARRPSIVHQVGPSGRTGQSLLQATASRSGPSGLVKPHSPAPPTTQRIAGS